MHAIEVIACGAGALGGGEAHIKLNFLCQIAKLGTIKLRSLSDYFKLFSRIINGICIKIVLKYVLSLQIPTTSAKQTVKLP